jgi:hypothetical protein
MDRRRFEAAHLKYACLQMLNWYPNTNSSTPQGLRFETDTMDTLSEVTPGLFQSFERLYAGLYSKYTTDDGHVPYIGLVLVASY